MRVLLVSHPTPHVQKPDFPPIGIAYLGAAAKIAGHEVLLIDGALSRIPQIVQEAQSFKPDFIGVTCWTLDRSMVWQLCAAFKAAFPQVFLAVGGPHATYLPAHIFKKTHAGAVVLGEGEETFAELLAALQAGADLKQVKGLALRAGEGVLLTAPRAPNASLDALPLPYYEGFRGFNLSNYFGLPGLPRPTGAIVSSRGCVFDCTYCGSVAFWGQRWRFRSAEHVLQELAWLIEKQGARSIYFYDDNFLVNKKRAMAICEGMLQCNWNIQWSCCSHVKMITPELLAVMQRSGCQSIYFGVESGSAKILKSINKKQTRDDICKAFSACHAAKVKPFAFLIVGNPGENADTIDETVDLIGEIRPWASQGASLLWLLPGTTVYEDAVRTGFIKEDLWLNSNDAPFNLQEHSYAELLRLRERLLYGIARKKGGVLPLLSWVLKSIYYRYPVFSRLTALVPDALR